MKKKEVLLIFVRNAELGKVKTRLAKTLGDENALRVYNLLLKHTCLVTWELKCDKMVWYSDTITEDDLWNNRYQKEVQKGNDLGERMEHAFETVFKAGYQKAVIIGSDSLQLSADHIKQAFIALDKNDVVYGPALDGGYYLLGMKKLHPKIFKGKPWGKDTLMTETLKELKGLETCGLAILNDIDTYEDLAHGVTFYNFYKTGL